MTNMQDVLMHLEHIRCQMVVDSKPATCRVIGDAIAFIQGVLDGRAKAASETPAEPSFEQCVEALNRAKHRGSTTWKLGKICAYVTGVQNLDEDELRGTAKLLIERERAEAAKGGA